MNELARETLVAAGLNGVRQIRGFFTDGYGLCAIGVLARGITQDVPICNMSDDLQAEIEKTYDLTMNEWMDIMKANDEKGWDFLTIARKIGVNNEQGDS